MSNREEIFVRAIALRQLVAVEKVIEKYGLEPTDKEREILREAVFQGGEAALEMLELMPPERKTS